MKTKKIIYILLIALLCLPALQSFFQLLPEKPLNGSFQIPAKPKLSVKTWFNDSFQEKFNPYLDQTIAFRPFLVRINNQIAFTIFDTALANGVIIGKKNCLYEKNYIEECQGRNFVGEEKIRKEVEKAKILQALLEERKQHLIIVLAPGKGTYFPENIPDNYLNPAKEFPTNYKSYKKHFTESGINLIDFNAWYISMKDTSRYPLYTKAGIHWSTYGVALAVDSLVNYMEKQAGIDMPDFGWDKLELTRKPRETDDDIAKGMNLLFPVSTEILAYPHLTYKNSHEKVKPNVIVIADSYYWCILGPGIAASLFNENQFWYYNQEVYSSSWQGAKKFTEISKNDELKKPKFIIVMFTDANLYKFPYNFFDDALKALNTSTGTSKITGEEKEIKIQRIMNDILASPQWKKEIENKAREKKVSFETMLRGDATWMYEQNMAKER